jgi:hypothetical protein
MIAGLIRVARPELATTALAKLSELLRYVVEASRHDKVPLAWELEFAASYLELQQLRFGPRLQFVIHEPAAGRACDVPPLLLQPLIENAVVHGVARTSDPVTIAVRVAMASGQLRVRSTTRSTTARRPTARPPGSGCATRGSGSSACTGPGSRLTPGPTVPTATGCRSRGRTWRTGGGDQAARVRSGAITISANRSISSSCGLHCRSKRSTPARSNATI